VILDYALKETSRCPELKWMEAPSTDFTVREIALQTRFLSRARNTTKFILFYSIEEKFNFESGATKGTCSNRLRVSRLRLEEGIQHRIGVNIFSLALDASCSE